MKPKQFWFAFPASPASPLQFPPHPHCFDPDVYQPKGCVPSFYQEGSPKYFATSWVSLSLPLNRRARQKKRKKRLPLRPFLQLAERLQTLLPHILRREQQPHVLGDSKTQLPFNWFEVVFWFSISTRTRGQNPQTTNPNHQLRVA